jgi:hypothetical protein
MGAARCGTRDYATSEMRSRAGTLVGLALLVGVSLSTTAGPAAGCSCAGWTPVEQAFFADAVFTGTVTSIRPTERNVFAIPPTQPPPTYFPAVSTQELFEVQLRTETVYKGAVLSSMIVLTARDSDASCGFAFELGRRYTVFAGTRDGELETGSCTATAAGTIDHTFYQLPAGVAPAGSEPTPTAVARTGSDPTPAGGPDAASARNAVSEAWPAFALAIGALVAIGTFFALRSRRRRSPVEVATRPQ